MTRIRFNIAAALARWPGRHAEGSEPAAPPAGEGADRARRRFRMMNLDALREFPLGPGWFDSSWDLDQGLDVELALPVDPTFLAWLDAQVRAFVLPVPAAVQAVAQEAAEGLLEFEPVDWKAWAPKGLVVDALPNFEPPVFTAAGLKLELEMPGIEFEPELSLVPA